MNRRLLALAVTVAVGLPASAVAVAGDKPRERVSKTDAHASVHTIFDNLGAALDEPITHGPCRPYARIFRICRVYIGRDDIFDVKSRNYGKDDVATIVRRVR